MPFAIRIPSFAREMKENYIISKKINYRGGPPDVFRGKGILNICSKFTATSMPKWDFSKVA